MTADSTKPAPQSETPRMSAAVREGNGIAEGCRLEQELAALRGLERPSEEAVRLALDFVADPDEHAQVKVQLVANGWPKLADFTDKSVVLAREILRLNGEKP